MSEKNCQSARESGNGGGGGNSNTVTYKMNHQSLEKNFNIDQFTSSVSNKLKPNDFTDSGKDSCENSDKGLGGNLNFFDDFYEKSDVDLINDNTQTDKEILKIANSQNRKHQNDSGEFSSNNKRKNHEGIMGELFNDDGNENLRRNTNALGHHDDVDVSNQEFSRERKVTPDNDEIYTNLDMFRNQIDNLNTK